MTVASNMESGNMGGSNGSEAMAAAAGQRWQQAASAGASARSGAAPAEKRAVEFTASVHAKSAATALLLHRHSDDAL